MNSGLFKSFTLPESRPFKCERRVSFPIGFWMRRAKSVKSLCKFKLSSMAVSQLSSVVFSHNGSLHRNVFPTFTNQAFFPIRSVFRFNRTWKQDSVIRSVPLQIRCTSEESSFMESSSDPSDFPLRSSYLSMLLSHGMKRLKTAVAVVLIFIQISSPLPLDHLNQLFISPATAVLYSPDTKIPRTGELALRKAIPANRNMKAIQESLEELSYLLRIPQRKPYGTMEGNVKKALKIAKDEKESILSSTPADLREKASTLYMSLLDGKGGLQNLLECIKDKDADRVSVGLANSLDTIAELELLQAPGLSFLLPQQYLNYPRLAGRGLVEFTIEKGDGSKFSPASGGEAKDLATIQVVIDGYSAPLTAGNFAKLVVDGAYNGMKLNCANLAVLSDNEVGKNNGYSVPLEIMPSGQFEPLYKTKLSVQDGELPVLPLSVYGAVAMSHSDVSEEYSSPSQFFFYLYDKRNSGLGGLSFDEGQFSVFGYTTAGKEVLSQIKTGDLIRSAKLVEGQDHLILPSEN